MPFTTRLLVTPATDRSWRLAEPLVYEGAVDTWRIPAGYVTDYASVPPVAAWLIPTYGRWTRAAIVHDYLITEELEAGRITPNDLDGVFRRILRELGVSTPRRWLMWAGVRWGSLFGGRADGWLSTAPAVLAISLAALPGLAVGGIGVLLGSIPLAVAEWFSPSKMGPPEPGDIPTMKPRALINHEALRAEVERRAQEVTERKIVGDIDGWRPTGIVHALTGYREVTREDKEDEPALREARERVDTERLAEAERLTGHPVHWDGSVLRFRDGTPVDLAAARGIVTDAAAALREPVDPDEFERRAAAAAFRLGGTTWHRDGVLWWGMPGEPGTPVDLDVIEAAADAAYLRKGGS